MNVLQEVTDWSDGTLNNIYLIKGQKILAFRRAKDGAITVFSKPLMFDRGGRRFKKIVDQELVNSVKPK